ncbi:MAG: phage terminase small subunit P27 family [Lactobacillus sp.]|nr:phage terminase small subunit P27 family [Lactobacillus sp.]MCI2032071.1 phage terminase small subunit P27 family [Lactobacillus sp.]
MVKKSWNEQNGGHLSYDPPAHLGAIAAAMWRKIVPFLEVRGSDVQRIDQNLVEMYCAQYEIYRKAYQSIRDEGAQVTITKSVQNSRGEIIGTDMVAIRRNPATSIFNDAVKQLTAIGGQLGLSPKSRAELADMVGDGSDTDGLDVAKALSRFMGKEAKQ